MSLGSRLGDLLAHGVAEEAADHEFIPEFLALLGHELADRLVGVLDERLVDEADRAVKFLDLTIDDFLDDIGRLAGGNLLAIGSKAGSLVSTGAQLAAAASTGGTSAVVMSASKMAGKTVLQRAVAHGTEKIANGRPMPTFTGFGRQIVVDGEGKSAIAPAKAPERKSVYDVTSMPRRAPSIAASSLRRQLTSAAVGKR